jgi:phage-related protein
LEEAVIRILKNCQKEIDEFPEEVREDLTEAVLRLELGRTLQFPLSRPMPSIGNGVHELRFRDRNGIYRVIYVFLKNEGIYLLHAFMKKTQQTSKQNIDLAKKRLKEIWK